jgi:hypothetical protein
MKIMNSPKKTEAIQSHPLIPDKKHTRASINIPLKRQEHRQEKSTQKKITSISSKNDEYITRKSM